MPHPQQHTRRHSPTHASKNETDTIYTNLEGYINSTHDTLKYLKDRIDNNSPGTSNSVLLHRSIAYGNIFRGYLSILKGAYQHYNKLDTILNRYFSADNVAESGYLTITGQLAAIKTQRNAINIANYAQKITEIYPRLTLSIGFIFGLMEVLRGKDIAYPELQLDAGIMLYEDLHIDLFKHETTTTSSTTTANIQPQRGDISEKAEQDSTSEGFNILSAPENQTELDKAIASIDKIYNQIEPVAKFIADNLATIKADYAANPIGDFLKKLPVLLEDKTKALNALRT